MEQYAMTQKRASYKQTRCTVTYAFSFWKWTTPKRQEARCFHLHRHRRTPQGTEERIFCRLHLECKCASLLQIEESDRHMGEVIENAKIAEEASFF